MNDAKILDGKALSKKIIEELQKANGEELSIITIGYDQASERYVKHKIENCNSVGLKGVNYKFNPSDYKDMKQLGNEIISLITKLNMDNNVFGIIIQRPYPKELLDFEFENRIYPYKDVDGLGLNNMFNTLSSKKPIHYPATPKGIITLLDYYNIPIEGKNVVIIGRSDIVGKPLAAMMTARNATVTLCHSKTEDLRWQTRNADIIISAVGKAKFLDCSYLSYYMPNYKRPVIIDVGMNRDENGKLCGDVDFDSVFPYVSYITKVPGGVGPMTIASLLQNLYNNLLSKYNFSNENKG